MTVLTFNQLVEKLTDGDITVEQMPVVRRLLEQYNLQKDDYTGYNFDLDAGRLVETRPTRHSWDESGCTIDGEYGESDWNHSSC